MSRIYFHSPIRTAAVKGSERLYLRELCSDIALSQLNFENLKDNYATRCKKISFFISCLGEKHYLRNYRLYLDYDTDTRNIKMGEFKEALTLSFKYGDFSVLEKIDSFQLKLNTAYFLGNDPIKLAARIDGQCEIHCWVRGENRLWLSQIIEQGLKSGSYKPDKGWEDVIDLLASESDNPVVLSYSVCEQFPNSVVAEWEGDDDSFCELDAATQWELGMKGLRKLDHKLLELSPANWNSFYFQQGWDMNKLSQLLHIGAVSEEPLVTMKQMIEKYESNNSSSPDIAWKQAYQYFQHQR